MKPTRGERNNNPGNIDRHTGTLWRGMADMQTDSRFVVFEGPEYGIRALAKVLLNYKRKHGLGTVREIVARWAPASENDTDAYANHVAAVLDVGPDDPIDVEDLGTLCKLTTAIIAHENGRVEYSPNLIAAAVQDAMA